MKKLTILFLMLTLLIVSWPQKSSAKTLTIAVIDTGIDSALSHLCKYGHKSFVKALPNPLKDEYGHGTHVAGLINANAGTGNYCLVAIKYYDPMADGRVNLNNMIQAIQYAINIKADFINISGGGSDPTDKERNMINKALNRHTTIVAAAGNDNHDLDKSCDYYPACYDPRIVVVGNLEVMPGHKHLDIGKYPTETIRCPSSNYGSKVNRWEMGTNVESDAPGGGKATMTGTSQATAIATGKLVKEKLSR